MSEALARVHDLKVWPEYFEKLLSGEKTFEARWNDRDYRVGDTLLLREWKPPDVGYTGRELRRTVTYALEGGAFGVASGFVILALAAGVPAPAQQGESREASAMREQNTRLRQLLFIGLHLTEDTRAWSDGTTRPAHAPDLVFPRELFVDPAADCLGAWQSHVGAALAPASDKTTNRKPEGGTP